MILFHLRVYKNMVISNPHAFDIVSCICVIIIFMHKIKGIYYSDIERLNFCTLNEEKYV